MNSTNEGMKLTKSLKIQLALIIISVIMLIATFFYSNIIIIFYICMFALCLINAYNRKKIHKGTMLTYVYVVAALYFIIEAIIRLI